MRQKKIDDHGERYHAAVHQKKIKEIVAVHTPVRKAPSSHTLKEEKRRIKATHTHTTERARY